MNNLYSKVVVYLLLSIGIVTVLTGVESVLAGTPTPEKGKPSKKEFEKILTRNYETVHFEKNAGQFQQKILYVGKTPQVQARFLEKQVSFVVQKKDNLHNQAFVWNMDFLGATPKRIYSQKTQSGIHTYLNRDLTAHTTQRSGELWYEQLYNGIDLRFYGTSNGLMEYDFVVAPGASPADIAYRLDGMIGLHIDDKGNLLMKTPFGEISKNKPYTYQVINGRRREVKSHFTLDSNTIVRFKVDEYDKTKPLIIDPLVMEWSTFLGGENARLIDMKVDALGNTYIMGVVKDSEPFPITPGVYQANVGGGFDIFISKLSPDGNSLIYSTYFGGTSDDEGIGLEINAAGEVFFISRSSSTIPITSGALNSLPALGEAVYFSKLNATGTALLYNARFGISDTEITNMLLTSNEELVIAGNTRWSGFPTSSGAIRPGSAFAGTGDAYVVKLNSSGSGLVYSTLMGGNGDDRAEYIRLDASDNVYVFGSTTSNDLATTAGVIQPSAGGGAQDTYLYKLLPNGSLGFGTYLGGSGTGTYDAEKPGDLLVTAAGEVYGIVLNASASLPTSAGAVQAARLSNGTATSSSYVFKLNTGATNREASYMTSSTASVGQVVTRFKTLEFKPHIRVSTDGSITVQNYISKPAADEVALETLLSSNNMSAYISPTAGDLGGFPITANAMHSVLAGDTLTVGYVLGCKLAQGVAKLGYSDITLTRFNPSFTGLLYSTLLGGVGIETVVNFELDSEGRAYIHGADAGRYGCDERYPTTLGAVRNDLKNINVSEIDVSSFISIVDETGGGLCYSSMLSLYPNGEGYLPKLMKMEVLQPNEFILGISDPFMSHFGTTNGLQSTPIGGATSGGLAISKFSSVPVANNTVSPISQVACRFASPEPIIGATPALTAVLPDVVLRGVTSGQPDPLSSGAIAYQWQFRQGASSWTNIPGATLKNFIPEPTTITTEFRRLVIVNCDTTISNIHTLTIDQARTAPVVNPGEENIFACTQLDKGIPVPVVVQLGGSPTASGGMGAPYTYSWSPNTGLSNTGTSNPTATLSDGVLFTLTVTDAQGCIKKAQTNVKIIVADAGPDVFACQGSWVQTTGAKIGKPAIPGITYNWSPATGLSNPNIAQPIANPSTTTTYTLTLTAPNGCTSIDQVTVTPSVINVSIPDVRVCADSPWAPDHVPDPAIGISTPTNYSYIWSPGSFLTSVTSPNPSFSVTQFQMTGLLPGYNSADWSSYITYQITATDPLTGCVAYDTMRVTVDPLPRAAGPTVGVCPTTNGQTIGVFDPSASPPGTSYVWSNGNFFGASGSTAATDLSNPTIYNPTISNLPWNSANSPKYLVATTPRGCKYYEITGCLPPCGGTTNVFLCNGAPQQIGYAGANGSTYTWTGPNGFSASSAYITVSTPGTYTQTIIDPLNNICTKEYVVSPTTVSQDAPDIVTCSSSLPVTIGLPQISGYSYQWSPGTGLNSHTVAQPLATPSVSTTYYVRVTETTTGCYFTDTVRVVLNDPIIDAGPDLEFCENVIVELGTPAIPGQSYSWQPNTGLLPSGNVAQPEVTLFTSQTFILTVTDNATGCFKRDTVKMVSKSKPLADAGLSSVNICPGGTVQLGTAPTEPDLVYSWSPALGLSSTSIAQPFATPTSNTSYVLTVSRLNSQGCDNTDQIVVNIGGATPPPANAGPDKAFCPTGSPVTIGTAAQAGLLYSWSPGTGLSSTTVAQPTVTGPINSLVTYTLTVTNPETGCTAVDQVLVSPSVVSNAGAPKSFCVGGTAVQIGTPAISGLSYTWSPSTGLTNAAIAQPLASPSSTTTYTLTVSGGGCSATSTVTVSVNSPPTVNAGDDVIICQGGSVQLSGLVSAGVNISWSPGTGLSCTNCLNPIASPTANTIYTLTATSQNGCVSSDEVLITLSPLQAPVANAGPDKLACIGGSILIGTPAQSGLTYSWSPGTNLSNPNIAQPTVFYPGNSSSILTYTLTVSNANGCSSTDQVSISPSQATAVPGSDATICIGSSIQLGGPDIAGYTYTWAPADGLSCTNCSNPIANPTTTTTYNLSVTNNEGCFDSKPVTITVLSTPIIINAGFDQSICEGSTVQVGSAAQPGYTYQWSPATGLSNTSISQPLASPISTTTYTVTVSTGSCTATDQVTIAVTPPPSVDAGPDSLLCGSGPGIQLGTPAVAGFSYAWSPSSGLSSATIAQPLASPTSTTFYILTVTNNATQCKATDNVLITVKPSLSVNAGNDQDLCGTTSSMLSAGALSSGETGSWTQVSGPSPATFGNSISSSTNASGLSDGTYVFRWTVSNGVCSSADDVTIIVATTCCTSPIASVSPKKQVVCVGSPAIAFSATPATGVEYNWYGPLADTTSAALGSSIATTSSFTPTGAALGTAGTKYYAVVVNTTGESTCADTAFVILTVNPLPTPSVNSPAICVGESATLTVTNCAGTVTWNDATTGLIKTVSPAVTTTYTATCLVNGCEGETTATVTVKPQPEITSSGNPVCASDLTTYTVNFTATAGATVTADKGTVSGSSVTGVPSGATVQIIAELDGCSDTLTVTFNCECPVVTPPVPSATPAIICVGESSVLSATGCAAGTVTWFTDAGLTTSLSNLTVSPTATTTYYAVCTITASGCASQAAPVTVTVNPLPTPSVNSPEICVGESATLTVTNCAGTVTWNDATTGLIKTVSPAVTTTYTATCLVNGCEGETTATVTVKPQPEITSSGNPVCASDLTTYTVNFTATAGATVTADKGTVSGSSVTGVPSGATVQIIAELDGCSDTLTVTFNCECPVVTPPVPSATPAIICVGESSVLSATGCAAGTVTWFTDAGLTTSLSNLTVSPTATTTYYAVCTITASGCASQAAPVTVTVNPLPTPSVNSPEICVGESATLTVTNCAGTVTWNDATTGLIKTVSPAVTTTYTATCLVNGCEGEAIATVTVKPQPEITSSGNPVCASDLTTYTVNFTATAGATVTADKGTVSGSSVTGVPSGETVRIIAELDGCSDTLTVTFNCECPVVTPPVPSATPATICVGESSVLSATGCAAGTVTWFTDAGLTTPLSNLTVSPTATTTYYAVCTITASGCASQAAPVTVTVNPLPTPTVNSPEICVGESATLTVTNCAGTVTWNDATTGLIKTVSPAVTTTYTATCLVNGCEGETTATVTVKPQPEITSSGNPVCASDLTTYTVNFTATAGATVTSDKGTVSGNSVTGVPSGETVRIIAELDGCSDTLTVTFNCECPVVTPPVPSATPATICVGESSVLSATGCASGTVSWFTNAGLTTPLSNLTVSPTATTTYYAVCTITASGCASQAAPVTVTVNPLPTPSVNSPEICVGESATLTVTNCAGTVTWNDATTGLIKTVSPAVTTTYTATCLVNGCEGEAIATVTVKPQPSITVTGTTCNVAGTTFDVTFTATAGTLVTADKGTVSGNSVTGVPSGETVKIIVTLDGCKDSTTTTQNCLVPTGSLGDFVWKDLNDNGQQDAGEPGVNGVKVILWSAVGGAPGAKLDSTITAGNGAYSFTNLLAGDYIVQIDVTTLPDSCLISPKQNIGDDASDNDFSTAGLSEVVTLDPTLTGLNKDNPTIDAGLISPKGSLGDFVWKDLNDNGQQDDGEPGVNGVKVILWSAVGGAPGAKLDSTTTAGNGAYSFTNLDKGDYIVQIDLTTLPDSCLISSKQNVGNDASDNDFSTAGLSPVITLDPTLTGLNKDNPTIDAGLISPKGSLGDFVWKDLNDNGQQDDGEPGVNGVKVILWSAVGGAPGAKLDSTTTAGNGAYSFTNLGKGDYIVQIDVTTLPDSCLISSKQNVGNDASDNDFSTAGLSPVVTLDPTLTGLNKNNPTIDAGLISPKGSLGDFVWKDLNDNGQQDAGEPGVNGVKVILWSAVGGAPGAKLDSTTTAGNGAYSFTNLGKGDYIVQIDLTTLPDSCLISPKQNVGDDASDNDFTTAGLSPVVTLDPTLTGLNKDNPTIDAGLISPKGSLGDFVWKDLNDNGQQDAGEPGVNGVKVILWSAVGGAPGAKLDSTTTAGNGAYSFTNLGKGDYIVQIDVTTLPDSCLISSKQNVGDDASDNDFTTAGLSPVVTLDPTLTGLNKDNPTIDAGLISPKGSLGDFVWKDLNDNGQQDAGEPGVNGVKVILWSANASGQPLAKLDSTTTAGNGAYSFTNLGKGDYIVQIDLTTLPDSCLISPKQNIGNDASDNDFTTAGLSPVVTLDPTLTGLNKDNPTIDAGLISPKGSLGDFVWKDLNDNGQQDAGEPGVNGVKVILWSANASGQPLAKLDSTTTAGNGAYSFTNLGKGNYIVQIDVTTLPDSCLISPKQNVGDDASDNDFTTAGLSPVVTLDPTLTGLNKDNPTIDAGLISPKGSLGDFVWKDLNDNGQQDAGEPGVNGVKVILWSAVGGAPGAKLDSTITAGNGAYSFTNLGKGDYIVQIDVTTLPDSCLISSKQNIGNDASDNDFTTAGLSPVVTLDPTQTGLNKDNPTIDAGLISPCVAPTFAATDASAATCDGKTAQNDASFVVTGISGGNKFSFATSVAGLANYASATALTGSTITVANLPNPVQTTGQTYIVRIYNGKDDCFTDVSILVPYSDCSNVCVKPNAGSDIFVCKPTTTADLPNAAAGEQWISAAMNPVGVSISAQTGVASGMNENGVYMFILRDATLGSTCSDTVFVFRGVLELPNQTTCFDTLTLPTVAGATWTAMAGNPATITSSGKISGMNSVATNYSFIISNGQCSDTIVVTRLNCNKTYDLALDKAIDKKLAMLGETLTYTIRVWNEGEATAHGIEVTDELNAGVQYLSSTADIGSYSQLTKKWSFDSLAVGDTVSLKISVKIIAAGVWFNTAEITKMTEDDVDSTPGNGDETEDDIDRECFTVPVLLCRGQGSALTLNVPQEYTGVVWFRKAQNGQPVQVAIGNSYTASETELGTYEYTFTSTSGTCPAEGCCPVIIVVEDCCPVDVCVPFVITKKVK